MTSPKTLKCRAVLFDLDGVLVDSTLSVERVWRRWAVLHGLDGDAIMANAHGRRTIDTILEFAPHMDARAEELKLEKLEVSDREGLRQIPGVKAFLSSLPPASWAVVTSGTRGLATGRLGDTGLPIPEKLVTAEIVTNGKPHPEPYLRGAELLGVPASECIVFEDTPAGIESGRSAGAQVIAFTTTFDRSLLTGATWILPSFEPLSVRIMEDRGIEIINSAVD